MELNITNISKVVSVDCGKCTHSNVCRYKADLAKGTNNISDKSMDLHSPFVLTLTCKYKEEPVIAPRTPEEKPEKKDNENIEEIVSNAFQKVLDTIGRERLIESRKVASGEAYSRSVETQTGTLPTESGTSNRTVMNPQSTTTTDNNITTDSRSANIKQLEEMAMKELQNNTDHIVKEKVLTKKKRH